MADIIIRPERLDDYAAIGEVETRAFAQAGVGVIPALQRQRSTFDPALSLVAEMSGHIIGHALFTPERMQILGQSVPVVNLGPIGVDPAYQGQGIGGFLIMKGHRVAVEKGYKLSFLLGHPTYYPHFGYLPQTHGWSQVTASLDNLPHTTLETRLPTSDDPPTLLELWQHEEGAVDMAIAPGENLLDWLSPNPAVRTSVYLRDKQIVGYTRISGKEPTKPIVFMAQDSDAAKAIVATMAQQIEGDKPAEFVLPLHPLSASASAFGEAKMRTSDAAMICPLAPSPFDEYIAQVKEGKRQVGRVIWPVAFDLS